MIDRLRYVKGNRPEPLLSLAGFFCALVASDCARCLLLANPRLRTPEKRYPDVSAHDEFLAAIPDSRLVDVGDAAHMVSGDQNDVFSGAVVDFLDDDIRPRLS